MNNCIVCNLPLKEYISKVDEYYCSCYRCGEYRISDVAFSDFESYIRNDYQKANLSGWIRRNQNEFISSERLNRVSKLPAPSVDEKASRLLLYLSQIYPFPGQQLPELYRELKKSMEQLQSDPSQLNEVAEKLLPIFSVCHTFSLDEIHYLLNDYLSIEQGYLNLNGIEKITPKGWAFIDSFKSKNIDSNIAFIAMKFEEKLKQFSEQWVETAIRECGYEPIRIDKYESNNLIDDEIIANIRKSRFLIADLTGNSYGVYFEAGFARGLNLPVIYLCSEDYFNDDKNKVHFDTNHYPFILWREENGSELKKKLKNRIVATIGVGKKYE